MTKVYLLGLSALFLSTSVLLPQAAYAADICPPFYSMSQASGLGNDIKSGKNTLTFSTTFRNDRTGNERVSRSITLEPKLNTTAYSQIFMNSYNILGAFMLNSNYSDQLSDDPVFQERWQTYCINPNDIQRGGNFTVTGSGAITYKTENKTGTEPEYDPETGIITGYHDTYGTDIETKGGLTSSSTSNLTVPYVSGIRDVARRIPPLLNTGRTFCYVSQNPKGCMLGYECQEIPPEQYVLYPERPQDRDGLCMIKDDVASSKLPFPAKFLCIDTPAVQVQERLISQACYSENKEHQFYEKEPAPFAINDGYLSSASLGSMTNALPFDIDAYTRYYQVAFSDKLGLQDKDDAEWMYSLPGRVSMSGDYNGSFDSHDGPFETWDKADKLGGFAELSHEMRFMNPDLVPIAWGTMLSNGRQVHMRGGDGFHNVNGVLFVDQKVIGNKIVAPATSQEFGQGSPFIHYNGRGMVVAALGSLNQYAKPTEGAVLYVGTADGADAKPAGLTQIGGKVDRYYPAAFINSFKEKIAFARVNGKYRYVATKTNFTGLEAFKEVPLDGDALTNDAQFAMDSQDNIHILWRLKGDSAKTEFFYSQLQFRGGELYPIVRRENVAEMTGAKNSPDWLIGGGSGLKPFDIVIAPDGQVMITVQGGSRKEFGRIWFATRFGNCVGGNCWTRVEIAAKPTYSDGTTFEHGDNNAQFFSFTETGKKIASVRDVYGRVRTYLIFRRSTRLRTCDSGCSKTFPQIFYVERVSGGQWNESSRWTTATAMSGLINTDWHKGAYGEGLDSDGTAYFTVDEQTAKFNPVTKLFDPPGTKQCIFPVGGAESTKCGEVKGLEYVIPPTQDTSADPKMQFLDAETGKSVDRFEVENPEPLEE